MGKGGGCQSQNREGSVQKMKEKGAQRNRQARQVQTAVDGGIAFIPELHCRQCVAFKKRDQGLITKVPHKRHNPKCPRNQTTRGMSARWVEVMREAARNIAENTAPIPTARRQLEAFRRANPSVVPHFTEHQICPPVVANEADTAVNEATDEEARPVPPDPTKKHSDPSNIRKVLDDLMEQYKDDELCKKEFSGNAPKAITLVASRYQNNAGGLS